MSATSGGGGSVSDGSEAGGSSQSTMSVSDSPSTSFQANLPENVTKITLSEENIAGGYAVDMTGSKINLSLDERQQKDGIVNVAFDFEEGANHGSGGGGSGGVGGGVAGSFGGGGGGGAGSVGVGVGVGVGGDFKSINGSDKKDKVPEAVNLELVNMVPYSNGNGTSYGVPVNGIPVKKDSEQVDMSSAYDEYFVPVNEHKKYMRGEKLYVTKDKRRPTSWRRCLSWIVACTVISVVLIVAILAGTGVILSEPNLVKEASVGRNFAGNNMKPSVTDKSPTPTAEMYMYVPRSIESEFVIDNLNFDPALKDVNSTAYQQFATSMEDQLKMLLFDKETLEFGASDVALKIVNVSHDPFKVNYRIGWNYKQGVNNPPEPIKMEDVKKRLVESLARNQGYIDKYHIDREAIKVNHVVNTCQMENGGCSHICYYNYVTQQFTCTCPTHLVLDKSGKNCVAWTGSSEDDAVPVPSHTAYPEMPYESTPKSVHEEDFGARYEHGVHQGTHHHHEQHDSHHEQEPAAEPEPTAEPGSDQKGGSFSKSEHDEDIHSSHDATDYGGAPEPTAEPNSEDKYHGSIHSIHGAKEPEAEPTPEPAPEPTADSNSENKDHSAHWHESKDHGAEEEPTPEPAPEPAPEPTAEDNSEGRSHHQGDHSLYGFKDHEPAAEPTPEPSAEPTAEPIAEEGDHGHGDHSLHGTKDHEPAAEPTPEPEPTSESKDHDQVHDHGQHSLYGFKEESAPGSAPEPKSEENEKDHDGSYRSIQETKDHEPSAEPTAEPVPEPTAEPNPSEKSLDADIHSVYETKDHEPAAEPTPEPSPEPTAEPNSERQDHDSTNHSLFGSKDHEPSAEPTPEPAPEPTSEPTSEGKEDVSAHHSVYGSKDHEPASEPTPEPAPERDSKEGNNYDTVVHSESVHDMEPTAEPSPDGSSQDHSVEKDHEAGSKPTSASGTEHKGNYGDAELSEPAPEPTPEPSADDDTITHFNSGTGEHVGTTVHSLAGKGQIKTHFNSGTGEQVETTVHPLSGSEGSRTPSSSDTGEHFGTTIHPLPSGEEMKTLSNSGSGEQIGTTVHPLPGSESSRTHFNSAAGISPEANTQSVPVKEDTNSKSSVTYHQSVPSQEKVTESRTEYPIEGMQTDSVKKPEHGAHLEDILIRKPDQNSENHGQNPLDNVELKANGEPVIEEVIIDKSGRHPGGDSDSEQKSPDTQDLENVKMRLHNGAPMRFFPVSQHQNSNTERETAELDLATDHPKIVEYSAVEYSTSENKNGGEPQALDNSKEKSPVMGNNDPSQSSQSVTQTNQDIPVTTTNPEVQHEYHTIPVTVELVQPVEEGHENQTNMSKIGGESPVLMPISSGAAVGEEPTNSSTIRTVNSSDQAKIHETTTEAHPAVTVPPSSTENNSHLMGSEIENSKHSQAGGSETTKTPEEISNNIKDELSENEEFNTLIDHEYKNKENGPNESAKYPNKPIKTEKKKIKDYVKGDKVEQKGEPTPKPAVTPAEFILQKHVNGNENIFDLDYSLQNEHTTKHDGGVTIVDPHAIDVPGVSLKPHGINNHDISVLQTVAPDFRTQTLIPNGALEQETLKSDSKNKEGEFKLDKDFSKFDKDYKYDKQKVSKKKDLKKKVGGKDGKNVELEDGRKYFTEITKDDLDVSSEELPETTMNNFEKVTIEPETGVKIAQDGTAQPGAVFETRTELEHQGQEQSEHEKNEQMTAGPQHNQQLHNAPVDKSGHLMIDEPTVKSTSDPASETYDGHVPGDANLSEMGIRYTVKNSTSSHDDGLPGTVFDGMPQVSGPRIEINGGGQNASFVIYENTEPKIVTDSAVASGVVNSTIHPTIIVNGQNDNLQLGHTVRFGNSTFFKPGNGTIMSILNGTLNHPGGHSFSYFPNGSAVNPTIVVRGQSGTLQGGHEIRFGNVTYRTVISPETHTNGFKNSNVYRIENGSLPGTVFDGHFNPQEGHYHMFTNASGLFVYTNASTQPAFVIKGQSGDFGNSTAYVIRNKTSSFANGFGPHSVIFRNSTVFAVEDASGARIHNITLQPHELNETIQYTHQMSPSFVSSGTAYKVNDYFGYISKCAAGQFQCLNGTSKRGSACISLSSKCDSINDCSDGSDELGCIENGCPGNFQCSDSTCLKRNLVCNGILDCSDGSDEKNCESWKCEFDEFQCPSGRCIPVVWQCDGKPDCDNHTDEYNCQTSCGNDEYFCPEGWCIPLTHKCNGVKECINGEDEQFCDCSHEEFKCQTGGCVSINQVCDGVEDCPDRSDEWDCVKLEPGSNLLKIRYDDLTIAFIPNEPPWVSATGNYGPVCADNWTSQYSDGVCASLGYFSSVPIENENNSSITTETSFYTLKNDTTADFNKKIIVNLKKSEGYCSSGKWVEISCQEFSCGSRSMTDSSSVEARLVGGMSATAGQWPSVALLYNVRNFHSCTANVLTPRWVLASYNCLKMGNKNLNEQDWKFFGGSTVFEAEKENAESRKILTIIPHPQVKFNQFLFSNDLALIELDRSLQFTSNLGAVCLPEQEIQPRQICVTAGWGMNTPEDKAMRQQLQYLPVPTMNLTECNSTEHYSGFITDDKICAGYNTPHKSLCYNEEGAPLMCVNDRGEWELQGVLSYHSNCGRGSHPSIFSSITPVSDWIKKTIGNSFERKVLPVTKR